MIEHRRCACCTPPTLGWRNVDLRDLLAAAIGLPVQIENSGRACAWRSCGRCTAARPGAVGDFVFVSVSDGLGLGVIIHGEVLRGRHNVAGEFGHVPLSMDGPRCSCGAQRVLGSLRLEPRDAGSLFRTAGESDEPCQPTSGRSRIEDLIARARGRDAKARAAIQATGRYLGARLVSVVNVLRSDACLCRRRNHGSMGPDRGDVRAGALRTRADAGCGHDRDSPGAAGENPRLQGAAHS